MAICPACSEENPDRARFCLGCGSPLAAAPPPAPPAEERKLVSAVFVDLVGFTARSEQLDPEDVHAVQAPYHARLRAELERHGGTVEKFIGDAVMALFGAPDTHEDDAERAVRAALAIRDGIAELNEARPDNPVGRKFDFLCQEFNREANTLCSKSADIELTRIGIDLKGAIERLREQVQNVE